MNTELIHNTKASGASAAKWESIEAGKTPPVRVDDGLHSKPIRIQEREPSVWISVVIFAASVALMVYLRLVLFGGQFLTLTYGLPLLLCLWQKDRWLLWSMAGAFISMAALKAFWLMPATAPDHIPAVIQWSMQITNILVIAATVHVILRLREGLERKHAQLQSAHTELQRRQDQITQQNVELQAQAEELAAQNEELDQQSEEVAQQNEELQQQSEELAHQNEELQQQSEELRHQSDELQTVNDELSERESMLQTILASLHGGTDENQMLRQACESLVRFGRGTSAAAVLERSAEQLTLLGSAGEELLSGQRPVANTFAELVMAQGRTAFVEDLGLRPDIIISQPLRGGRKFCSVLSSPLSINGRVVGVVEAYSFEPRQWSKHEFRIIEWAASQCSTAIEIMRLQRELAHANEHLERKVEERTVELRATVHQLEQYSYSISHDMRAPLRAMNQYSQILLEDYAPQLGQEAEMYLQRIARAAHRLDRLISDVLMYHRLSRTELMLERIELEDFAREIIQQYPALHTGGAEVNMMKPLAPVRANVAALTQCLSNLLDNAVKFVAPGVTPSINIRTETRNGFVRVWVEDNGIGVQPSHWDQIWGIFHQAHSGKGYDGTGIGLSIVKKAVERMGGRVGVESEPGQGSRFWFELQGG